ncbi:MAG: glycosyltransferase [Fidelibacterota bacterium]|nr:MAG: glycosyltransferase [Candidatus Neomarinimicrobiota bacterium]
MTILFWAVAVIIILYLAFLLWIRVGLWRLRLKSPSDEIPKVSVIVAAKDEAQNLPYLLDALRDQTYPADHLEVIVADDGSTDDTPLELQLYKQKMSNLHSLRIDQPRLGWGPKKWAVTEAIKAAHGEIILTTDADCIPGPRWVEQMVQYFNSPTIGMVLGPSPMVADRLNLWRESLLLDSCAVDALAAGGTGWGLALTCTGRNLAYRLRVFEEVEGFKGVEHFISGDDDLLMQKVAATRDWKITFALGPDLAVPSPPPGSIGAFVRQRLRFASKGRYYFRLETGPGFKLILPFIYIANLTVLGSIIAFAVSLGIIWLTPVALKIIAEAMLVYPYLRRIQQRIRIGTFIIASLFHPLYVVVFGALGNLHRVVWKGRRYAGSRV